jgi:hypothetical protein
MGGNPTLNFVSLDSTEKGRIFMAGSDGFLYEFVYQKENELSAGGLLGASGLLDYGSAAAPSLFGRFHATCYVERLSPSLFGTFGSLIPDFLKPSLESLQNGLNSSSPSNRIQEILVDKERNILYTASSSSSILVWDLGRNGESAKYAFGIENLYQEAYVYLQRNTHTNGGPIIG